MSVLHHESILETLYDEVVAESLENLRKEGFNKMQCSPLIAERLSIKKILRKASKDWDGGYVMAGMIGHGDSFVFRDPAGIRPAYYYIDDEVVVVASERPVIQTAFNVSFEKVLELVPGSAIITKKDGSVKLSKIIEMEIFVLFWLKLTSYLSLLYNTI